MPYNLVANLILILSILGVIILVLRRLPQAVDEHRVDQLKDDGPEVGEVLAEKGLPTKTASRIRSFSKIASHKVWQFVLEAKGLKHNPKISYNFKRILKKDKEAETKPPIARNEDYYIELIKRHPKELVYYDQLGQFYLEARKYEDAANVYDYLTEHEPTNSGYFAKLGLSQLHDQEFAKSQAAYEQSVKLDPSHPNRFYNLALTFQGQKKWKSAVKSLDSALELDPENGKYADLRFEMESKGKTHVPVENIHKKE
ncbi:MAG TPA: tetratricopeptide repeat protein [Patescibacteria group bacterium]|jgi:tetratricopeptide (TPR) repeat protein|nr:tetratricopeptide repeat protein [Patescibacteria group bacterium]